LRQTLDEAVDGDIAIGDTSETSAEIRASGALPIASDIADATLDREGEPE